MKFLKELLEGKHEYGIAVSHEKNTSKFEDIRLVDWNTDHILDGEPSHAHDMFEKLVAAVKRNSAFNEIESIVHRYSRSSKNLGSDFDDDTNHITTKYGPFSDQEIGQLAEEI